MGATHFKMKTLAHVATEMALHVLAYNIKRVIAIIGVPELIKGIAAFLYWPAAIWAAGGPSGNRRERSGQATLEKVGKFIRMVQSSGVIPAGGRFHTALYRICRTVRPGSGCVKNCEH